MSGPSNLVRDHKLADVKPARGKLLVKLHGAKTTMQLLKDEDLEPEGEVLAVGAGYLTPDGVTESSLGVTVGDMVLIGRAPVTPIKIEGTICYLVGANALEAVIGRVGVSEGFRSGLITK